MWSDDSEEDDEGQLAGEWIKVFGLGQIRIKKPFKPYEVLWFIIKQLLT